MQRGEDSYFEDLKEKIKRDTAFDCHQYKDAYLKRRFAIRMRIHGARSYQDYMKVLDTHPEEYKELIDTLTINVTEFMRDPSVYDAFFPLLRDMISIKRREGDKRIKIWSAGCSTGEEPYSIAILLNKALGEGFGDFSVRIIASDIDEGALRKAREGLYKRDALKNLSENEIRVYFTKERGLYRISDELKRVVRFVKHDLIHQQEYKFCDVIFCRNVAIYFSREQQKDLYMKFYRGLKDGGYFIAGKSETLVGEAARLFSQVNAKEKIYQKRALR
ncbi:protein-glutamate O-methyltransferase CheR [Methanosarcinales archaeon]|nr:MAG: protein-glutamate O-methyltransferase CheR [Methanosarcinales archaeon]